MPEDGALIHYRCTDPKHQASGERISDKLTIHEKRWAYCPFDARAKPHTWTETGGITLSQLRLRLREARASQQSA